MGRPWVFLAFWGFAFGANADTIINNSATIVINARPLPIGMAGTRPAQGGTTPPANTRISYQPSELIAYLPPHCAQLYESMLYGPQRHESGTVLAGVRSEFSSQCGDAMTSARQALIKDKLNQAQSSQAQRVATANTLAQTSKTKEQCDEMLRNLVSRRNRVNAMSEGELADLARFEDTYTNRCK